ncbi:hypothetical protein H9Y04_26310 [Streptomyces sp. TRM66268-LWL]|uniref:Butirosin biosynthesis protein H N-terminal domain-containing protein n=1 Tax=Streptomyces polyasparticus TaxID=2767826 RepID=A0ABR7SKQ8_9ACTN|nr:hypothetical protein [Streptomyces polyasparticus]MBC9716060.1 hypothetical protein [Streptomyces polyasparticus]
MTTASSQLPELAIPVQPAGSPGESAPEPAAAPPRRTDGPQSPDRQASTPQPSTPQPSTPEITRHVSAATGTTWDAVESLYYDCHVVSLAQLLPSRLFGAWLLAAGAPRITAGWGGLHCRNLLDSEAARDVVLFDEFGVRKHHLPIEGDTETTVRAAVRAYGHCIARVDSYYHEHFAEYYLTQHRTNGHKVTVIDFDESSYTGIDNVGIKTLVLRFERQLFLESIRSNLFHVYDKHDSLYRLEIGPDAQQRLADGTVLAREQVALAEFLAERIGIMLQLETYRESFTRDLAGGGIRAYAQLANSYHSALMIERAYLAVTEAHARSRPAWSLLPDEGTELVAALDRAIRGWRMFKMLCKAAQDGNAVGEKALLGALDRVLDAERDTAAAAGRR